MGVILTLIGIVVSLLLIGQFFERFLPWVVSLFTKDSENMSKENKIEENTLIWAVIILIVVPLLIVMAMLG